VIRVFFLSIGSVSLLLAGCSIYDSSLTTHGPKGSGGTNGSGGDYQGGSAGQSSGGATEAGGSSNGGAAGAACNSKTYPPPPLNKGLGGDIEIVAIQADVDLGDSMPSTSDQPTRFRGIGFDLDHVCTTSQNQLTSCTLPADSDGVPDGPEGQDNAMGQVIQLTRNLLTNFSSEIYSAQLRKGAANTILHVTGYNGLPDDDQVQVEVLVSARYNAFDPKATPKWDGNDTWPVAEDSVIDRNLKKPKNVDPHGYVRNGKLVASLGDTGLRLLIGFTDTYTVNLTLFLHASFNVCDIVPTDAGPWGYTLKNCTLAGRWTADDLIKQLWHFPDPLDLKNPKPLCTSSTSYAGFKSTICSLRDITSSGTAGPTAPCDALSMGVNFQTAPARIGDVFANDLFAPTCPSNADPSNDSCDAEGGVLPIGMGGMTGAGGAQSSGGASGAAGKGGTSSQPDAGTDASAN
jgi:hypothetical protein